MLNIYNIGRLGIFGSRALRLAELEEAGIFDILNEEQEGINWLGRGIMLVDKVITVNLGYSSANPLLDSAHNAASIVAHRVEHRDMTGIRNAIDYE